MPRRRSRASRNCKGTGRQRLDPGENCPGTDFTTLAPTYEYSENLLDKAIIIEEPHPSQITIQVRKMNNPPSELYQNIMIARPRATPKTDVAEIGGIWATPDYAISYLLAARQLLESGKTNSRIEDIAIPLSYLQRHALELAPKNLINLANHVKYQQQVIDDLRAGRFGPVQAPRTAPLVHDFSTIIQALQSALSGIGFGAPPPRASRRSQRLLGTGAGPCRSPSISRD